MQQPYQKASEAQIRQAEEPQKYFNTAVNVGASVLGAGVATGVGSRVLPFLSKYIPQDLFTKGISKISPGLGKFVNNALNSGETLEEVKEFIGQKYETSQKANEKRNIIEQYDPELHTYIQEKIRKGQSPLQAGSSASKHERFRKAINQIKKDHKTQWSDVIQSVYGMGEQSQQPAQQMQQPEQAQQQGPQMGSGQQKMMAILQEIAKSRGVQQ